MQVGFRVELENETLRRCLENMARLQDWTLSLDIVLLNMKTGGTPTMQFVHWTEKKLMGQE